MDTLEAIFTRRSIRKFLADPISEELTQKVLAAAMQAPMRQKSATVAVRGDRRSGDFGRGCGEDA